MLAVIKNHKYVVYELLRTGAKANEKDKVCETLTC